jgi:hypothetical protein
MAGMLAVTGAYWPGFLLLAVPGALCLLLLAQLCRWVPSVAESAVPNADAPVRTTGICAVVSADLTSISSRSLPPSRPLV